MSYLRLRKMQAGICAPRRRFETREVALIASRSIVDRHGVLRMPEPCSKCNGWHLEGKYPMKDVKR